jgi:hypothetical protein
MAREQLARPAEARADAAEAARLDPEDQRIAAFLARLAAAPP